MKKIVFLLTLIGSIVAIIGSCGKKDETTSSTSTFSAPTDASASLGYNTKK